MTLFCASSCCFTQPGRLTERFCNSIYLLPTRLTLPDKCHVTVTLTPSHINLIMLFLNVQCVLVALQKEMDFLLF